nr:hypothetical protein BaRGS_009241 [Batillaria attramentaria]
MMLMGMNLGYLVVVACPPEWVCRRVSKLVVFGMIYLMMWGSSIYYNAKIVNKDGEEVNGWSRLFEEIIEAIDPEGEANAYKVLGLNESATQEEIKIRYRKLAKEWHPDKQKDPTKKEEAQLLT